MKKHANCCEICKRLQRSPQDPEIAKHYDLLVAHLVCLKNPSDLAKCARKKEIKEAAQWILDIFGEDS